MALLICTEKINPRISYVFQHIFGNVLGVDFSFCHDVGEFIAYDGPKIVYGQQRLTKHLNFKKHPFIDEANISEQDITFADYRDFKIPFAVKGSAFNFDVFAASFYLLSRYEEYVSTERDEHLRFQGKSSLAYKCGFLDRPLIDEWAYELAGVIKERYPKFEIKKREFKYIPTLDIDRPFYFRNEGWIKKLAKFALGGFKKDPFDIYEQVASWDHKYGLKTVYFFLMGTKHLNDVSPGGGNKLYQTVIKRAATNHQIGIHPSYYAALNPDEVISETELLAKVIDLEVKKSRQHFLMLRLPETYRALIDAGIKSDYTLAYADVAGFRASTCTPLFWYDLKAEEITDLLICPTAVMDQTLRRYMALSPKHALQYIKVLMNNVKAVNGTFVSLWHNESVNNFGVWKGWKSVYERMLTMGAKQ